MTRSIRLTLLLALSLLAAIGTTRAAETTEQLLQQVEIERGICVVVDDPACRLAIDLAGKSDLLIYAQLTDAEQVDLARAAAEAAGLDATRLQIDQGNLDRLHLADNVADAVIVLGQPSQLADDEVLRVLRPGARALLDGRQLVKPQLEDVDQWTHPYHGPDNNPVSADRRIRPPYLTQFLADPRYGPAPQQTVSAGGRVFKAFGHVAWHEREEPYLNTLVAFNGHNGTILWKRSLPEGLMVHRNTITATPEVVYLGDDRSCKCIDAMTGKLIDEITPPVDVAGGTFWKWMALEGDVLFALIGESEPIDETTRWKRQAHGWPWTGVSKGYNEKENPWGFGRNLLAIDRKSKKVLWHYREDTPVDSRAVGMKNGRIYAFRFGEYLTCLDATNGQVLWRKTKEDSPQLFETLGAYQNRQGWQTNWRTTNYLKCSERAIYFAGPQMGKLLAVSTDDGRVLWEHPYDNFQLIIHEDAVYAISGPWGNNVSKKFDPLTGEVLAELPTGRRACTRPTATSDSILYRAMGGSIRFDLASQQPRWVSPMRPSCHDGVTVANGLLYWWPYVCDCQLTLNGATCVGPAGDFDFAPDARTADRLERGPDPATPSAELPASDADWPTFRANNRRTASSHAIVPETANCLWQARPAAPTGVRPTPPVAVGDFVMLSGSDGVVRALNARSGGQRWTVRTGGEIRIPPTVSQGRALVGSGDGWVYALEASTGRLLWRFRAAPADRKIPVYGRLLSTWPAASGVLIDDGTAYVAAGIVNYDGTYVYGLDAATGQVRWCNDSSGHLDAEAQTGVSVQGHLLLHEDKLYMAGGNAVSPAIYNAQDGTCLNDPAPLAKCESTSPRGWELFLLGDRVIACGSPYYTRPDLPVYDHTVTKKLLHASAGQRDIVWLDTSRLLCYPPLDKDALSHCVTDEKTPRHITQAWGQFRVDEQPFWQRECMGSVAVAVAANAVVIADASRVAALGLEDGRELWSLPLPAAPVPWGMAINRDGNVILTLADGQVLCVGKSD